MRGGIAVVLGVAALALFAAGCATSRPAPGAATAAGGGPVAPPARDFARAEGAGPPGPEAERVGEDLVVRRIAERAWVVTHERPYPANSLLVQADDESLLLVDTPWTPEATKRLLSWIKERFGPKPLQAVNTHFHLDSLGGNPVLRGAGIRVAGHGLTRSLLTHRGLRRLRELRRGLAAERPEEAARLRDLELAPPGFLYVASRFTFPFGSERYELIHPGAAHSPDNLVVWFPDRRLLFGGCMVKGGASLGFLGDADLESWPGAVRKLQALDPAVVVPGHGDRLDPRLLQHTLDLLEEAASGPPTPESGGGS